MKKGNPVIVVKSGSWILVLAIAMIPGKELIMWLKKTNNGIIG